MVRENVKEFYYKHRYKILSQLDEVTPEEREKVIKIVKDILEEDYSLDDELFTIKM